MGLIKILDESVSNAIAAGEVVENPTSMIKELIENSLDAGSKEIKIDVRDGGLNLNINDDGCGMVKEDLLLSVERHATSKISKKEDLFNINTYGFRGEALSSISAVSKMIIASRTETMNGGVQINILGGKVTNMKDVSKNVGTYIEIKDLFYNTPARLKFLRKESTEYLNMKDVIIKEALANPNVKFLLNIDGKESIKTSGNGIENTILEIFGKGYLKNVQKFSLGFLGNRELFKSNRESIFVFVNGRAVKSKIVEAAVIDAYHTKLMKGKYPFVLIFLEVNPAEIDVNVHPSKKIIKFANQGEIYKLVKNEIDRAFYNDEEFISPYINSNIDKKYEVMEEKVNFQLDSVKKEEKLNRNLLDIEDFKKNLLNETEKYSNLSQLSSVDKKDYTSNYGQKITYTNQDFFEKEIENKFEEGKNVFKESNITDKKEKYIFNEESTVRGKIFDTFSSIEKIDFKVIGQLFDTFILVERNGLFEIYDQHIIHERILYEKLKQEYANKSILKQDLLVPIRISLDPREKELLLDNLKIFSNFGFEIDDFQNNEILIRSTPAIDLRDSNENIFKSILSNILENKNEDIRENIIISMSCKGAIKANHKLSMDEMYSMVSKLHKVGEYTCPHGRPIIVKMTLSDLEKLFKRK